MSTNTRHGGPAAASNGYTAPAVAEFRAVFSSGPRMETVNNHKEWSIACRDVAGRRRDLTVFVRQGRVVLVAPPGETAVLAPLDVGRLRAALRDAVLDASKAETSKTEG